MSSKPKKVVNLEIQLATFPSQSQDALKKEYEDAPPSPGTVTKADSVESLVGDYLKELDALSAELKETKAPVAPGATAPVEAAVPPESRVTEPARPRIEGKAAPEKAEDHIADVEAELARALDELETQERSNVVTLPLHEVPSPGPEGTPWVSYPESSLAASAASPSTFGVQQPGSLQESPTGGAELKLSPLLPQTPISFDGTAKPFQWKWKAAIGVAAVILLGGVALAVFRLLPSTSSMGSNPQSGAQLSTSTPPAINPDSSQGAATSTLENDRSGAAPESKQPAAAPRSNPAKAPPGQPKKAASDSNQPADKTTAGQPSPVNPQGASVPAASSQPPAQGAPAKTEPAPAGTPQAPASTAVAASTPPNPSQTEPTPPPPTPAPATQTATPAALQDQTLASKPTPGAAEPSVSSGIAPVAAESGAALKESADPSKRAATPVTSFSPAVAISKVAPQYPPMAQKWKMSGTVVLAVQVDEQGKVLKATAVSGPYLLRLAAEEALMKWQFKPAARNGVNVSSEVRISVLFQN